MSENDKCPPILNVQDFLFKEESVGQICDEFPNISIGCNLIAVDNKRGLLYVGHENKLIVAKFTGGSNPQWKFEIDLPYKVIRVELNCDYSYLAVSFDQPTTFIYDASSISKHKLDKLHDIRLSSSGGNVSVLDLKWNPAIPDIICSITSDHTIGCFQVSKDKGIHIIGKDKPANLEALCVSWSPKGKQIVVGCKNGDIVQLKPELKIARHLTGPNPNEGVVVSILWVSNYQFCACYLNAAQERVGVMIVNAPKGVTAPQYINYEDITYGSGSLNSLSYYFEFVSEWGIIIAGSTHSSELAVLGTADNGATWNLWQLMEGSNIQLPMNRKKETENYPLGITVDKTSTQRLPWGPDYTLPNPVPILRILLTSGQMSCYHMINMKNDAPIICSPPTETISSPSAQINTRSNIGSSEVSFNLPSGATSTPQKNNNIITQEQTNNTKQTTTNQFGSSNFSFAGLGNKFITEASSNNQVKSSGFAAAPAPTAAEIKTTNLPQQPTFSTQPAVAQHTKPVTITNVQQQQQQSNPGFSTKQPTVPTDFKIPNPVSSIPVEPKPSREKQPPPPRTTEQPKIIPDKQTIVYEDGICQQAFQEEQARFEIEIKKKLQISSWNIGTEEERQVLVKKTNEIEEFSKELQELTTSLASDVTCLKALLLQSFAWTEETKSKKSFANNTHENSKLSELKDFYDCTQSLLIQATKVLDSNLADHKDQELKKQTSPTTEMIYETLMKHWKIIAQEKKNIVDLEKKLQIISRLNGSTGINNFLNTSGLEKSMADLSFSSKSKNDAMDKNFNAIHLRCKLIANNTRNFSKDKQTKLRDLLAVTEPTIIPATKPTAVQEKLQNTLSTLASLKASEVGKKTKPTKVVNNNTTKDILPQTTAKSNTTKSFNNNPLSSLENLVTSSGISKPNALNKSPSSTTPFAGTTSKAFSPPKANVVVSSSPTINLPVNRTINFTNPPQKIPESAIFSKEKASSSDTFVLPKVTSSSFSFGKPTETHQQQKLPAATSTSISVTTPKFDFSITSTTQPKSDNSSVFKFSTKTNLTTSPQQQQQQVSSSKTTFDMSSLNLGGRSATTSSSSPTVPTLGSLSFSSPVVTTNNQTAPIGQQFSFGKISLGSTTTMSTPTSSIVTVTSSSAIGSNNKNTTIGSGTTLSVPNFLPTTSTITTTSSAPLSTTSFTGLLGALTTSTPTTTATTSSFGNIFGGSSSTAAKTDSSVTSLPSTTTASSMSSTTNLFKVTNVTTSTSTTVTVTTTSSIFGNIGQTTTTGNSMFGGQTAVTSSSGNGFFNTKPPAAAATTTSASSLIFNTVSTTSSSNPLIFGGSGGATAAAPVFASSTTTQSSNVFTANNNNATQSGTSIFGGNAATPTTQNASLFGSTSTTQSTTGSSIFASNAPKSTSSSVFGTTTTQSGGGLSMFGGSSSNSAQSTISIFGNANTTFGATTTTSSPFGAPSTNVFGGNGGSLFGAKTTSTSSSLPFGASAVNPVAPTTTPSSPFGSSISSATTAASTVFGTPTANRTATSGGSSIFGNIQTSPATGASVFGGPPALGNNSMFGGMSSSGSMFGQQSAFGASSRIGASPTSGGSVFGSGASGFGSPSTFGQTSGFGSTSTFGATAAAAASPANSTSPGRVFGSNTFENLGAQSGGLSFGSLAQNTTEPGNQQSFQGSSSFSSWR